MRSQDIFWIEEVFVFNLVKESVVMWDRDPRKLFLLTFTIQFWLEFVRSDSIETESFFPVNFIKISFSVRALTEFTEI